MDNKVEKILNEIKKAVVGKDEVLENVLASILSKGNVLLEDVPGVGKTTLAVAFSKALGLDYKRIQFTPDTMPADIIGFSMYDKATNSFVYKAGPCMTNLLLADEINRTSSKTQSALLEVMEENKVTVDGVSHPVPEPFSVIATQNPVGSAGTQMLPNSQLDRFIIRLKMGYPDSNSQFNILKSRQKADPIENVEKIVTKDEIKEMQDDILAINVDDSILKYIVELIEKTRSDELIKLGVSPRGMLALNTFSKAKAFIDGRDYVIPDDIINSFKMVCSHRIILNSKAKIANKTESEVLDDILNSVASPDIQ